MMPEVIIENLQSKTIDCTGNSKRLLDILLEATDWMHACGGKGRCTTCTAIVLSGADQLSALTPAEARFRALGRLGVNERQACQTWVLGRVTVRVPDAYKLPHLQYSS